MKMQWTKKKKKKKRSNKKKWNKSCKVCSSTCVSVSVQTRNMDNNSEEKMPPKRKLTTNTVASINAWAWMKGIVISERENNGFVTQPIFYARVFIVAVFFFSAASFAYCQRNKQTKSAARLLDGTLHPYCVQLLHAA